MAMESLSRWGQACCYLMRDSILTALELGYNGLVVDQLLQPYYHGVGRTPSLTLSNVYYCYYFFSLKRGDSKLLK